MKIAKDKQSFINGCLGVGYDVPFLDDTKMLSQPGQVGNKKINNRIVYQPMEGCDGTFDGRPDELTIRRYHRFAKGAPGIIWFEAMAVMNEGRANPRQLFINEDTLDSFKRIVEDIKNNCFKANGFEPLVIAQLTHSGRYSKPNGKPEPLIAYNNPIFEGDNSIDKSRILSDDHLDKVGEKLIEGALLAQSAGFDGADIKCCHRYLLSELTSAYNRSGKYGGSFENRTRLLYESVQGAKAACSKDFIVTTRLNAYDGFEYPFGFGVNEGEALTPDFSQAAKLIQKLSSLGVQLVNITMGNPYFNPHVNRPFAVGDYKPEEHPLAGVKRILEGTAEIKANTENVKIICSGLSYLSDFAHNVAAAYISNGGFDFAGFGRQIFANPNVANDIVKNGKISNRCIACSKCSKIMRNGGTPGCVIYDKEVYLPIYKKYVLKQEVQ